MEMVLVGFSKTRVKTSGVSYAPEEYVKEQCWVALGRPH